MVCNLELHSNGHPTLKVNSPDKDWARTGYILVNICIEFEAFSG